MTAPPWLQTTFAILLATSLASWCVTVLKLWRRQPLIVAVARESVPWNLVDVWLALATLLVVQAGVALAAVQLLGLELHKSLEDRTPTDAALQMMAGGIGTMMAGLLVFAYLKFVRDAKYSDLGVVCGFFLADLRLGVWAFLHLIAPVMLVQLALTQWWPSAHPIISLLKRSESVFPFVACIVTAVVIAPIVEEFLFRVVLQGWLEKLEGNCDRGDVGSASSNGRVFGLWPVAASAAVFSLAHFGNGPDMVALFVFALGLGYLYRQTHRLLPGIVVHFLLNAWSMLALVALVRGR